ncbi:MAG: hypothetical protein QM790_05635 [Nibricoccus sp.]
MIRQFFAIASVFMTLALAQADVPKLAKLKAAAEAGNAEAQYEFAKTFGPLSAEWKRWLTASANQGYGPAEDELAWIPNGFNFSVAYTDPKLRAVHLRNSAQMKQALIYASAAADKGFSHSRLLLAHAYANGYFVSADLVEAYKWTKLSTIDLVTAITMPTSLKERLLKTLSLEQVKEGEARAANYRPGHTALEIRNAMIIPSLKLAGIVTSNGEQVALVNGTRLKTNQEAQLNVDGLPVNVRCLSIDAKTAVICLLPGETKVSLRPSVAAEIVH